MRSFKFNEEVLKELEQKGEPVYFWDGNSAYVVYKGSVKDVKFYMDSGANPFGIEGFDEEKHILDPKGDNYLDKLKGFEEERSLLESDEEVLVDPAVFPKINDHLWVFHDFTKRDSLDD